MVTALISDLHLGTRANGDLARRPEPRERLLAALAGADRIVVLGDVLELRERPVAHVLDLAEPFFRAFGEAAEGKQVVFVPGNHDHHLGAPYLEARALEGTARELPVEWVVPANAPGLLARIAGMMPGAEVSMAYPGLWLRDDVYATHGHYLDAHLTIPRLEGVLASLMARVAGVPRGSAARPSDYEASLSPLYALAYRLAQHAPDSTITRGGGVSRGVWKRVNPSGSASLGGLLIGRVAIPAGVGALNLAGLGPFDSRISGEELREAGLRAMAEVAAALGVDGAHVIFGHTHRPGPLPRDAPGSWRLAGGGRLWNTGSWLYEPVLGGGNGDSPYWPGTVVWVRDDGEPELERLLGDLSPADLVAETA